MIYFQSFYFTMEIKMQVGEFKTLVLTGQHRRDKLCDCIHYLAYLVKTLLQIFLSYSFRLKRSIDNSFVFGSASFYPNENGILSQESSKAPVKITKKRRLINQRQFTLFYCYGLFRRTNKRLNLGDTDKGHKFEIDHVRRILNRQ